MTQAHTTPNRDKTHRVDARHNLQKDDPKAKAKDERAGNGKNSTPARQGHGVDERGRYGSAPSATRKT